MTNEQTNSWDAVDVTAPTAALKALKTGQSVEASGAGRLEEEARKACKDGFNGMIARLKERVGKWEGEKPVLVFVEGFMLFSRNRVGIVEAGPRMVGEHVRGVEEREALMGLFCFSFFLFICVWRTNEHRGTRYQALPPHHEIGSKAMALCAEGVCG